jgi:hypothetical protein
MGDQGGAAGHGDGRMRGEAAGDGEPGDWSPVSTSKKKQRTTDRVGSEGPGGAGGGSGRVESRERLAADVEERIWRQLVAAATVRGGGGDDGSWRRRRRRLVASAALEEAWWRWPWRRSWW